MLEELAGRGPLTGEQEAELAELQRKVAQRKQQKKEKSARRYRRLTSISVRGPSRRWRVQLGRGVWVREMPG
ncbi:hypothetical protein [Saccharopolyspora spinosa]|uniref:hypothetical protein n=1 Tax=Saccharopolyspora spinosa TaxID=60894 RepID=UPI001ED906DE|nr:hypothetical protein [Saccharopolyspora spinosa]